MNKEDILYKLSQGTYTAVWAHDEIRRQSKRIAELENKIKGSAYLHMAAQMMIYLVEGREIVGSDWDYINDSQYEECQKAITIRDLRQQAKGIDWVLACRELNLSEGEVHTLMDKCNKLRKQADELEQGE